MDFHNTTLRDYESQQAADHRYLMGLDSETCWQDAGFCDFWDDVEALNNTPVTLDEGWALDEILDCYKAEKSAASAVEAIKDGFDPTPDTPYDFFH